MRRWEEEMEMCAFCGKQASQVRSLIKAPNSDIYICDACSKLVFDLSDSTDKKKERMRKRRDELAQSVLVTGTTKKGLAATPAEIHRQLDRYIIGQDKAKKVLSVAVYNHSKRLNDKTGLVKKSNILLVGPSGCGKTLLASTLAKLLDVPFAMVDATSLTEAGYVGDDVDICLQRLLDAAGGDVDLAQKGVVFIDEIDKIASKGSRGRDIGGGGVQAALLKLIEGSGVSVPSDGNRRNPNIEYVTMDTTDILFVCGGAFDRLTNGSERGKKQIGFSTGGSRAKSARDSFVSTEELIKYGMMPEFIGRFPVVCTLEDLEKDDLVRILTEPEDAITKEYGLLLKKDGVRLEFEQEALEEIAGIAIARKTGARGLRSIIEEIMLDIMYGIPECTDISKCVITAECIKSGKPLLVKKRFRKKQSGGLGTSLKIGQEKAAVKEQEGN